MKALKLSNTPEGLKLARCLFGSPIICQYGAIDNHESILCGQHTTETGASVFVVSSNFFLKFRGVGQIIIPIDTMVFDPFAAMREKVSIVECGFHAYPTKGFTTCIEDNTLSIGCSFHAFIGDVTLDIDWAATLDGVEVVEL